MSESRLVRVAVYAVAVSGGAVLLTRLADNEPLPGGWTLPGGGLDFGEAPLAGLHREVHEETGLAGEVEELLVADSLVIEPHPVYDMARIHALRLVYSMRLQGTPRVVEEGGSTVEAAWIALEEVPRLERVELVDIGLAAAGVVDG